MLRNRNRAVVKTKKAISLVSSMPLEKLSKWNESEKKLMIDEIVRGRFKVWVNWFMSITTRSEAALPKNALPWFFAILERSKPRAVAEEARRSTPIYSHTMMPVSKCPKGSTVSGTGMVKTIIEAAAQSDERNFPITKFHSENGKVRSSS